jgi:hypothetical protein
MNEKVKATDKVREGVDDAVYELQRMADEIRVKIHLGSMDAKDTWKKLEPKLGELEKKSEQVVERTGAELQDLAKDLKKRFLKLKDELKA